MHHKRLIMVASLLVLASLLLTACPTTPPTPETVVVTSPPEEVVVTATPPPPPPAEPKTMVICQGQEPDTLYNYGGSMLAASHIQHAIYDGLAWVVAMVVPSSTSRTSWRSCPTSMTATPWSTS